MRAVTLVDKRFSVFLQAGRLQAGDRLPSERELCNRLHTSRRTLRKVLAQYETSGLIERRGQAGTFLVALPPAVDPDSFLGAERVSAKAENVVSCMFIGEEREKLPRQVMLQDWLMQRGIVLHSYFAFRDGQSPHGERRFLEQILEARPRGVIVQATPIEPTNAGLFRRLENDGIRVAHLAWYRHSLPDEGFFLPDIRQFAAAAAGDLARQGCRRLAIASSLPAGHPLPAELRAGLRDVAALLHMQLMEDPLPWSSVDLSDAVRRKSFDALTPETGIIALFDSAARRAVEEIRRGSVRKQRTVPMICITERVGEDIGRSPWPVLCYTWLDRAKDAVRFIFAEEDAARCRFYGPRYVPAAHEQA